MANSLIIKTLNSIKRNPKFFTTFSSQSQIQTCLFTSIANAQEPQFEDPSSLTFTFSSDGKTQKNSNNNSIYVKAPSSNSQTTSSSSSMIMPMLFDWFDSGDHKNILKSQVYESKQNCQEDRKDWKRNLWCVWFDFNLWLQWLWVMFKIYGFNFFVNLQDFWV